MSSATAAEPAASQAPLSPKTPQKKPQIMDILDNQLEQLADELTRRKANSATSTPTTAKRTTQPGPPPPPPQETRPKISPKVSLAIPGLNNHSHPFSNMYHPRTFDYNAGGVDSRKASNSSSSGSSSGANSRKTSNESANDDWQDPGQLLNAWLGELDSIRKGLDEVTPARPMSPAVEQLRHHHIPHPQRGASAAGGGRCNSPSLSTTSSNYTVTSRESSATPVHMRRMSTPRVESPRLDSYRYSLINLEDSLDNDLDAILGELCALESNFNNTAQQLQQQQQQQQKAPPPKKSEQLAPGSPVNVPPAMPASPASHDCLKNGHQMEHQYITAEIVRQNKAKTGGGGSLVVAPPPSNGNSPGAKRTDSPDNDSAFCDNASTSNSGNSNETNDKAVLDRLDGHLQLPVIKSGSVDTESITSTSSSSKAEKIRIAIEKIKEASIKKIFIKVFGEDGSAKSLLVDERMSVSQVCRMLADKNHVKRDTNWSLVELLPDLHMERAYEDHEQLVENLLMWKADSKNTLWFIKRPEVHDIFSRPEVYLLGETSSQIGMEMDERARAELVEEYFSSTGVGAPEVEGFLWLKAESKKSWKKFHFVLRTSGLYYAPKAASASASSSSKMSSKTSHATKDLVCLARFDVNQVYYGVKWQAKFKSPTRHCFAIKHPQIQAKNPKYIRYLAADSEQELNKWVTGIRVAKYGKTIYENYRSIIEEIAHEDIDKLASARLSSVSNHDEVKHSHQHQETPHLHHPHHPQPSEPARTPDSNENKSFDSAFQLSDSPAAKLPQQQQQTQQLLPPPPPQLPPHSIMKHHSGGLTGAKRSSSSGSLSDRSGRSSVEHGFNCDSPEGGTIKKKPGEKHTVGIVKQALMGAASNGTAKPQKGVRFLDSYSTIPPSDEDDGISTISSSNGAAAAAAATSALDFSDRPSETEKSVYNNIDRILATNRSVLARTSDPPPPLQPPPPPPLQRRYSSESLVSNPAMLHTGAIVHSDEMASSGDSFLKPSQVAAFNNKVPNGKPDFPAQPDRPAPVLKPSVARKPSIDKSVLIRKNSGNSINKQQQPTYEDTLKKCQSLTNSRPQSDNTDTKPALQPKLSPALPPKPSLAALRGGGGGRVAHLPPSGVRSNSANGRLAALTSTSSPLKSQQHQLNQAFLNDLHTAMAAKLSSNGGQPPVASPEDDDDDEAAVGAEDHGPPTSPGFPNRFSSGEYDNIRDQSSGDKTTSSGPAIPKRNNEHLPWKRS